MLEIRITAPELAEAINNLAGAIRGKTDNKIEPNAYGAVPQEALSTPPVQTPTPQTPQPLAPPDSTAAAPAPTVVPTAAPQYTLDMIAKAGTALIDAGKMNELTSLLAKYGVYTLTALAPSYYPAFVTDLRAIGAQI